jgi:5'-nucleotidase/UDP-sugar diphosphatase
MSTNASAVSRRQTFSLGLAGLSVTMGAGPSDAATGSGAKPSFTLVLVNDIYRMGDNHGRGGFARLAAIVKAERARQVPMLFCHAGDTLSPSLMSGFDQGAHIVELTNLIRPDIFVPGNHEFDFGRDVYFKRMAEANFPFFAANMRQADGSPVPGMHDHALVSLGPVTIGLIGLAFADTPQKSQSGDLVFQDELTVLRREAAALRAAGADMLVAVAHTDRAVDNAIVASRLVDVLLSGHDHDLAIGFDGKTVMVESSEEGYFVTAIDFAVTVSGDGAERKVAWLPSFRVHDSSTFEPDPDAQAVITRLEGALSRELDVEIGATAVDLDSRTTLVRTQETAIGNLVADAVRASTGADVAIFNGGGIRANVRYAAGHRLTRRDILSELPFGNTTVLVELNGTGLKALLEHGFAVMEHSSGRFPQVSGLKVVVDPKRPAGDRVLSVQVGDAPLDPSRTYSVGANNFMFSGGDDYGRFLTAGRVLVGLTDGSLIANAVMGEVRRVGTVTIATEGRITLL